MSVHGVRVPDLEPATLYDSIRDLLSRYEAAISDAERIAVLPDAHYPHHPSTGMVTDPSVVEAAIGAIEALDDEVPVTIAVVGAESVDDERIARYLGYETVAAETGSELVTCDTAERTETTTSVGARSVRIELPDVLDDALVCNVPTVRVARETAISGAMVNLARPTTYEDVSIGPGTAASVSALSPAVTLVDGTRTFTGKPHETRLLLASGDPVAVDQSLAELLGFDRSDEPYLRIAGNGAEEPTVSGVSIPEIAEELPGGGMPASGDPHPLLRAGYKAYTRISGDAYPPQFMGEKE